MNFFLLSLSYADVTRLFLLLLPLLKQFPFLFTFFPLFLLFCFRIFLHLQFLRSRNWNTFVDQLGMQLEMRPYLYKTNGKRLYQPNHDVNTLEKTPTKYPYDRLRKEPLKNRTIKDSIDKIKGRKRILTSFQAESPRRQ